TPARALLERAELRPLDTLPPTSSGFGNALVTVRVGAERLSIDGPGVLPTTVDLAPRDLPACAPGVRPCAPSACRATPAVRGAWFDPELGTLLLSLDDAGCRPEGRPTSKLDFPPRLEWRVVPLVRRR
ncbi:MAG: hypothetical protein JNJ59_28265, partial [Deltaproteobacteria bacterium]|nr:hypothetical protein [Deltaproteobacteria bacterium]